MPAQITALPTPPSTNDPANFNTRADAFLGQMPTFVTEANALATEIWTKTVQAATDREQTGADRAAAAASAAGALGAPGTNGSSTTSLAIGTGTKTFTTQIGKAWIAGQGFFLASSASPLNWMTGILTAYNSGTGAATVEVDAIGGSGTFAAWNCGLSAGRPMAVATQAQAEAGTDATTIMTPQRTAQAALTLAFPVGTVTQSAANPGARWVPCNGQLYAIATYPSLAPMMTAYINPMTLRLSASDASKVVSGGGVFLTWISNGSTWSPYTSPDGVTWTQRTSPFGSTIKPGVLAFGGGLFVASYGNLIFTSPDGAAWTSRSSPFSTGALIALARGGATWIGVGTKDGSPAMVTSNDGITWTLKSSGVPNVTFYAICYSADLSRWLAVGGQAIWTSDDAGVTWTSRPSNFTYPPMDAVSGGARFVIATSGGGAWYSSTGLDGFTRGSDPFGGQIVNSVIWDGLNFIAGSTGGFLARSPTGVSWAVSAIGTTADIVGVAKASSASAAPIVLSMPTGGLRSGLDVSTTQFYSPTIAGAASGISAYIKGA